MIRLVSKSRSPNFGRSTNVSSRGHVNIRHLQTVSLQLDYYMSPQFAGIACAMTNQLYEKNGIDLKFLPICPVGHELQMFRDNANKTGGASEVTVGSVEQNIFIPTLYKNPDLRVKGVAAMFRRSPLCLASLKSLKKAEGRNIIVGAHADTVSLLERLVSSGNNTSVMASPRSTKVADLTSGKVDAIQAYMTTEVPTLQRKLGVDAIESQELEGLNGAKLGYSQMLFAPEEDLDIGDKRAMIESFLDATFEGWQMAIRNVETAAESVVEAKAMLGLNDENNDHWDSSFSYNVESVRLCSDYVKETFQGDRYGVINANRWNEATEWLLAGEGVDSCKTKNFGIDANIWQPSPQLLAGNELARVTLESAKKSAGKFAFVHGRKPSLGVITIGELVRYTHSDRRLNIYSNNTNSWFNKTSVGEANGFDVTEITLPKSTSTDELLSHIYALKSLDGIQLMWPLPNHIDSAKVYNAIEISRDVDGVHYIGQVEVGHKSSPMPAVTPAAAMALMENYGIELRNKGVLVIGRSRIAGSPVAHMLRDKGAIVTVAHSEVAPEMLESLVRSADIVVSCAGSPDLLNAEWVKAGAEVINIGTTFSEEKDSLVSDFEGDLGATAKRFSPVPGGIGPLSVAHLFKNVAGAAWERAATTSDVEATWTRKSGSLNRSLHFKNYDSALEFANRVNEMSTNMDHHANLTFSHKCVSGVDLDLDFFTYEASEITEKDYTAARAINAIIESEEIRMSDFTYDLNLESIAKFPADPRGSSRLLRVDTDGNISHFQNFSESFLSLAGDAHIVFNESKVANGRVNVVRSNTTEGFEMMILDIGDAIYEKCNGLQLTVMLRKEGIKVGQVFTDESSGTGNFKVVNVVGPWIEDEHSNGNGTECFVECIVEEKETTLGELLEKIGTVPIPPYLDREAMVSDTSSYNNVYALGSGSVAAPTAGLHFTDELLENIGKDNMSFLSLHVGAGTFKPVVTEDARDHEMHSEQFTVNVGEIRRIINVLESNKRMIVVGTTSSRTLESMYWCGVKKLQSQERSNGDLKLGQHEWRELEKVASTVTAANSLRAVIEGKRDDDTVRGRTSLMIVPGAYDFKVVDELVTKFHAPDSTLMLLVSAFLGSGQKVRSVYEEAQDLGYRFLSYGDVCYFSQPKK